MPPPDTASVRELDPARFAGRDRPHVAVVDIGSNSVRLVVYDQLSRAPFPRFNEKSLCRLGAGIERDGRLADAAIDHTLRTITRFHAIARAMDVERIDVLATESLRRAPNGAAVIDGIRDRTGLETRVLEGHEEAAFSALGVVSGFFRPRGLVGDLGGGSLDVAEVLEDTVGDRFASLPLGALPVSARLAADGYRATRQAVDALLAEGLPPLLTDPVFYAVGGGWRALAAVEIARRASPCQVAHGFEMEARALRTLAKEVARAGPEALAAMPGVPSRRIDTMPAAALVLDRVLKHLKPARVAFSALGLREGWLYSRLPEAERRLDPLIEGAQAFGMPRARVPEFPEALVRWTDGLFPAEAPEDRRLRVATCALSDFAWRDHANVRAVESFRRLLQLPFIGVSHGERVFLAATLHARHSGKPDDPALAGARETVHPSVLRRALVLGRAMQLGYRLSGSVPAILDSARLSIDTDLVRVEVRGMDTVPDSDTVQARLTALAKAVGVPGTDLRIV